jgi:hypothetical protein
MLNIIGGASKNTGSYSRNLRSKKVKFNPLAFFLRTTTTTTEKTIDRLRRYYVVSLETSSCLWIRDSLKELNLKEVGMFTTD